jgi:hypothetical protein
MLKPVVVVHTSNQRGEEDEAGGSRVRGQPGLHLKKNAKISQTQYSHIQNKTSSPYPMLSLICIL